MKEGGCSDLAHAHLSFKQTMEDGEEELAARVRLAAGAPPAKAVEGLDQVGRHGCLVGPDEAVLERLVNHILEVAAPLSR